jgi:hypothetical protein
MPLLAYCIAEAASTVEVPPRGVQDAPLRTLLEGGLISFLSQYDVPPKGSNHVRESALAFNRVLQDLLRQIAIVPFRFPTLVADESEIRSFLQQHATEYQDVLVRLHDVVQLEINLVVKDPSQPQGSGKQYLLARQTWQQNLTDAAEQVREHLGERIRDWRRHQSSTRTRCYLLVSRHYVESTLERLEELNIPAELRARVTGPWPPTEFIALPADDHDKRLHSLGAPVTRKSYD